MRSRIVAPSKTKTFSVVERSPIGCIGVASKATYSAMKPFQSSPD